MTATMEEEALAAAEELLEQLEASEARRRDLEQELLTTRKRNIDLEQDVQDLTESLHLAAERIAKEENMRAREVICREKAEQIAKEEAKRAAKLREKLERTKRKLYEAISGRKEALREIETLQTALEQGDEFADEKARESLARILHVHEEVALDSLPTCSPRSSQELFSEASSSPPRPVSPPPLPQKPVELLHRPLPQRMPQSASEEDARQANEALQRDSRQEEDKPQNFLSRDEKETPKRKGDRQRRRLKARFRKLSVVDENEDENNATDVKSENEQRERCALLSDPAAASALNDEDNDVTVDAVEVLCGDLWGERVRVEQKPETDDSICRQVHACGDANSSTASRRHRLESLDTSEKALSTQGLHLSKIPPQAPPGTAVPWTPPASMSKNLAGGGRPAGWLSQLDWDTEA